MAISPYSSSFYEEHRAGARRSAQAIVPLVLNLLHPKSVVDVGCGDGNWLAVFRDLGVTEFLGVDGEHVPRNLLQIPNERFRPADLSKPFSVGTFDLALSLEVAEHLPPSSANVLVKSLTNSAPAVLFSAAIPHQGGEHHINEQWPEVWASLFRNYGYVAIDAIRHHVWSNDAVDWWYAQNTLLYVRPDLIEATPALQPELARTSPSQLSLVHPRHYLQLSDRHREALARAQHPNLGVAGSSILLLSSLKKALQRRVSSRS